jgi:hypothetical protein
VKIRFQADADLNHTIVLGTLRQEPAIDFQTAAEANMEGLADPDVLALAAVTGRLLVSHDRRTMPWHFADFVAHTESPGLIIVPQKLPVADAIEELLLLWALSEPSEWTNRICALPL